MNTKFTIYDRPQKAHIFRDDLIAIRGHKCECCGNTQWLKQPITLEIHHKNGNKCDNTLDNLILLCPNCHSYTDNYGSKNKKHKVEISDDELAQALMNHFTIREALLSLRMSDAGANYTRARKIMAEKHISLKSKKHKDKENFCIDCGASIYPESIRCIECKKKFQKAQSAQSEISREELKQLIRSKPFVQIGQMYGVTDNAIRKWCKNHNLPRTKSEINKFTDEEWLNI